MHPSKFFEECVIDDVYLNANEREKILNHLKSIHPRNFLGSSVDLFVVKMNIEYKTDHGNRKETEKYTLLPLDTDGDISLELQAEVMCESNIHKANIQHLYSQLSNFKVKEVEIITRVTLPLG